MLKVDPEADLETIMRVKARPFVIFCDLDRLAATKAFASSVRSSVSVICR
jgi:hypothetical protein